MNVEMTVPLNHYLILAAILFSLGGLGVLIRRNALVVFMCIELMLNAVNLTFLAFSRARGEMDGHVISFFVIAVAAAEAAVGLAIFLHLFRGRKTLNVDDANLMRH